MINNFTASAFCFLLVNLGSVALANNEIIIPQFHWLGEDGVNSVGNIGGRGGDYGGDGGHSSNSGVKGGDLVLDKIIGNNITALITGNAGSSYTRAGGGGSGFGGGGAGSRQKNVSQGGDGGNLQVLQMIINQMDAFTQGAGGNSADSGGGGAGFAGGGASYAKLLSQGGRGGSFVLKTAEINELSSFVKGKSGALTGRSPDGSGGADFGGGGTDNATEAIGGDGGFLKITDLKIKFMNYITQGHGGNSYSTKSTGGSGFGGGGAAARSNNTHFSQGGAGGLVSIDKLTILPGNKNINILNLSAENSGIGPAAGGGGSVEIENLLLQSTNSIQIKVQHGMGGLNAKNAELFSNGISKGGAGGINNPSQNIVKLAEGGHSYIGNLYLSPLYSSGVLPTTIPTYTFSGNALKLMGSGFTGLGGKLHIVTDLNLKIGNTSLEILEISSGTIVLGKLLSNDNALNDKFNEPSSFNPSVIKSNSYNFDFNEDGKVDSSEMSVSSANLVLKSGTLKLSGNNDIYTMYDHKNAEGSHLSLEGSSKLEFDAGASNNIIVVANADLPDSTDSSKMQGSYQLINKGTGSVNNADTLELISREQNSAFQWQYNSDSYTLSYNVDPSAIVTEVQEGSDNAVNIASNLVESYKKGNKEAKELLNSIAKHNSVVEATERLLPSDTSSLAVSEAKDEVNKRITDRILDHVPTDINVAENVGISAGDNNAPTKHGIWVSPFAQTAKQKKYRQESSGYKLLNRGFIVGYDNQVNDTTTVGLGLTHVATEIKHQGLRIGNKSTVSSNVLSIYGLHDMLNNSFLSGSLSYLLSTIKNTDLKSYIPGKLSKVRSNYNSQSYMSKIMLGHKINVTNNVQLLPTIALLYSTIHDDPYQEKGANVGALSISKKRNDSFDSEVGLKAKYNTYIGDNQSVRLEPSVWYNAMINLDNRFHNFNATSSALNSSLKLEGTKKSKYWHAVGVGMSIHNKSIEYSALYEISCDKKYLAQEGGMKIRINF